MRGYRNLTIALAGLICTSFLGYTGIREGAELLGLGTVIGAIWGGLTGVVIGRGYNKRQEAANGGIQ